MTTDWIQPGISARLNGCGVGVAGSPIIKVISAKHSGGWARIRLGSEGAHYPPAYMNVRLTQLSPLL